MGKADFQQGTDVQPNTHALLPSQLLTLARQRLSKTMLAIPTVKHFWLLSEHILCYSHNWFKIPQQKLLCYYLLSVSPPLGSHLPQDPPLFLSDTHLPRCVFLNKLK